MLKMRIIVSFPLLLVLCNSPNSFEMVISKGLELAPETSWESSSGETTQTPEITDVPRKDAETDLLNDVDLPQLPTELTESSVVTTKERRCARHDIIVGSPRDRNTALSLNRRDTNLEKRKQQCEKCKKRPLCSKYKACSACNLYCGNPEDEATTVQNTDDNAPTTEQGSLIVGQTEKINVNMDNDDAIVAARFGESSEESASTTSRARFYSLGSVEPGPLMHLFAKAFNIPSEEKFAKLIILGQMKGSEQTENLDDLVILDLAQVFGIKKKITAIVHESSTTINTAKIEELNKALDAALMIRKQELNADQLSTQQIHEVVNQVLAKINQRNSPIENEVAVTDPSLQLPETQTKCSVDDAMDDLIDIMSVSTPERAHETKHEGNKPAGEESGTEGEELSNEIKNPPIIQDSANLVGENLEYGWVDDNEEARPSIMVDSGVKKHKLSTEDPQKNTLPNDINPVGNTLIKHPKETEILTLPDEVKPALESDNQVNDPVDGTQQRMDNGSEVQTQDITGRMDDSNVKSQTFQQLEGNIFKIVQDNLKTGSSSDHLLEKTSENVGEIQNKEKGDIVKQSQRTNPLPGSPIKAKETDDTISGMDYYNVKSPTRQQLEENIFKVVQDSLKTVPNSDHFLEATDENLRETQNKQEKDERIEHSQRTNPLPGSLIVAKESKPVFAEDIQSRRNTNNEERTSQSMQLQVEDESNLSGLKDTENLRSQEAAEVDEKITGMQNTDNEAIKIQTVQTSQPTQSQEKDENLSSLQNECLRSQETAEAGEKLSGMQNPLAVPPAFTKLDVVKEVPTFINRDQFSDDSVSQEKLTNFGSLVPVGQKNEDSPMKKLYFVGKDIKLPLRMYQDEYGVMQLRVDMNKLCHCKNKNCTRKHADNREVEQNKNDLRINDEKEYRLEENTVLPELSVRFERDNHRNEQLMNSFVDGTALQGQNSDKHKRSPTIDSTYKNFLDDQSSKSNGRSDESIKSEKREEKLENEIKKLSTNIEKYNEENPHLLNKGNVALFKDVEKTKDVGRMITLANNVLIWMKELTTKNLRS